MYFLRRRLRTLTWAAASFSIAYYITVACDLREPLELSVGLVTAAFSFFVVFVFGGALWDYWKDKRTWTGSTNTKW